MRVLLVGGCGYVGSALFVHLSSVGHEVQTLDTEARGNFVNRSNLKMDYREASVEWFSGYDGVVHLAGHSSVGQCIADPYVAIDNNLTGMIGFVKRLAALDNPPLLLWASSGSVLSDVISVYDTTKRTLEALIPALYPRSIGLRFASVCGASSQNIRHDNILNAMVKSAVETGVVNMANPLVYKPILGLKNLCACVEYLISREIRWMALSGESNAPGKSIVDLCSFTTNPEQAAQAVSAMTGAKINRLPPSHPYEFRMGEWCRVEESLESIIADLVAHYRGISNSREHEAPSFGGISRIVPYEEAMHRV